MKAKTEKQIKARKRKIKLRLEEVVNAAHDAGMRVSVSLEENMPLRFPNDPKEVTLLIEESERMTALGNKWAYSKNPNPVAANACFNAGWAHALSANWLRCKLKGELLPESEKKGS